MNQGMPLEKQETHNTSFGAFLRGAREQAGMSVARLSGLSGIPAKTIEAFENGDRIRIPSDPYAYGVLKKYAQWCGIPYAELVARWNALGQRRASGSADNLPRNRFRAPSLIPLVLTRVHPAAVLVALALGFIAFRVVSLAFPVRIELVSPGLSVAQTPVLVQGVARGYVKSLKINNRDAALQGNSFRALVSALPGPNTLRIQAWNFFGRATEVERIFVLQQESPRISPSPSPSVQASPVLPSGTPSLQETAVASSTEVVY